MSPILLLIAFLCSLVATALAFGWFGTDPTDALGWLSGAVAFYLASLLVPWVDRRTAG